MVGLGLNLGLATASKKASNGGGLSPIYTDESPTQQSTIAPAEMSGEAATILFELTDTDLNNTSGDPVIMTISDGSSSTNRIFFQKRSAGKRLRVYTVANGTNPEAFDGYLSTLPSGNHKIAIGFSATDFRVWINGMLFCKIEGNYTRPDGLDSVPIGRLNGGGNNFSGTINKIDIYNGLLTDDQGRALTRNTAILNGVTFDATKDLYLFMGQSNSVGQATGSPVYTNTSNMFLLGNDMTIGAYTDPYTDDTGSLIGVLDDASTNQNIGYAGYFADKLSSNISKNIMVCPANLSGTGLAAPSNNTWNTMDDGYRTTGTKIIGMRGAATGAAHQIAMAAQFATIRGVIWGQGERDADDGISTAIYEAALTALIAEIRSAAGNLSLPWLNAGMAEYSTDITDTVAKYDAIITAQQNIAAADTNAYFITGTDLPGIPGDEKHYSLASNASIGATLANTISETLYGITPPAPLYTGMKIELANASSEMRISGLIVQDKDGNNIVPVDQVTGSNTASFSDIGTGEITHNSTVNGSLRSAVNITAGDVRSLTGNGGLNFFMKFDTPQSALSRIYVIAQNNYAFWTNITFTLLDSEGGETIITPTSALPTGFGDAVTDMTIDAQSAFLRFDFEARTPFTMPAIATGTVHLDSIIEGVCGEYDTTKLASFDPDTDAAILNSLITSPAFGESVPMLNGVTSANRLTPSGTKGTTSSELVMTNGDEFCFVNELEKAIVLSNFRRSDIDYAPFLIITGKWNDDGQQKYLFGTNDSSGWAPRIFLGTSQNIHYDHRIFSSINTVVIPGVGVVVPDGTDFCMVISLDVKNQIIKAAINADTFTISTGLPFQNNIQGAYQETCDGNGFDHRGSKGGRFGVMANFDPTTSDEAFSKNSIGTWSAGDIFRSFAFGATNGIMTDTQLTDVMTYMRAQHGKAYN